MSGRGSADGCGSATTQERTSGVIQASVDSADMKGRTALMHATEHGHKGIVDALTKEGTSLDCADKNGTTALLFAAQHEHKDTIVRMLQAGAQLNMGLEDLLAMIFMISSVW